MPKIEKRKLDDLMTEDVKNPFALERTTERVLVKREKERQIERLDGIKHKIEHKYLHGVNLMSNLSVKHKQSTEDGDITLNR